MRRLAPLLFVGLLSTAAMAPAQGPPQVVWEADASATVLAFSPDGTALYTGGRQSSSSGNFGNIKRWDVASTTELYTLTGTGSGAIGLTNALAVSPDGSDFASGNGSVSCPAQGPCTEIAIGFHTWGAASGASQVILDDSTIDGVVQAVTFSKDGDYVAFTMSRTLGAEIVVYDYPSFTLQGAYDGHGDGTFCAAFSPTDNLLATGGWDGTVQLWDVDTNQLVDTLVHGSYTSGGYPISVDFSPDGSQLAVSGSGYSLEATVWDVSSGSLVYSLPADSGTFGTSSARIAFSPNGRYLVGGVMRYASPEWQGVIQIWDMVDGSLAKMYTEVPIGSVPSRMSVAVSPDASDLIAYTYDNKIKFADTDLDFGGSGGSLGSSYCGPANPNSTGLAGQLSATGSLTVAAGDVTLTAGSLPQGQFAYFLNSMTQGFFPNLGGGQGNLCLAGPIGRYNPAAGYPLQSTGAAGAISLTLDLASTPTPTGFVAIMAGETWNFQCWYRDLNPFATNNLTQGLSLTFR